MGGTAGLSKALQNACKLSDKLGAACAHGHVGRPFRGTMLGAQGRRTCAARSMQPEERRKAGAARWRRAVGCRRKGPPSRRPLVPAAAGAASMMCLAAAGLLHLCKHKQHEVACRHWGQAHMLRYPGWRMRVHGCGTCACRPPHCRCCTSPSMPLHLAPACQGAERDEIRQRAANQRHWPGMAVQRPGVHVQSTFFCAPQRPSGHAGRGHGWTGSGMHWQPAAPVLRMRSGQMLLPDGGLQRVVRCGAARCGLVQCSAVRCGAPTECTAFRGTCT